MTRWQEPVPLFNTKPEFPKLVFFPGNFFWPVPLNGGGEDEFDRGRNFLIAAFLRINKVRKNGPHHGTNSMRSTRLVKWPNRGNRRIIKRVSFLLIVFQLWILVTKASLIKAYLVAPKGLKLLGVYGRKVLKRVRLNNTNSHPHLP